MTCTHLITKSQQTLRLAHYKLGRTLLKSKANTKRTKNKRTKKNRKQKWERTCEEPTIVRRRQQTLFKVLRRKLEVQCPQLLWYQQKELQQVAALGSRRRGQGRVEKRALTFYCTHFCSFSFLIIAYLF